jgi:hypothetical protein
MALALSQAFLDAYAKANPEPVLIVKVTTGAGTSTATFGRSDNLTYPESVLSVTPITKSLDILSNAVTAGGLTLQFAKDNFFEVLWQSRLKNQKIEVLIGEASMSEGDYEPFFLGVIESVKPTEDRYVVSAKTPILLTDEHNIVGAYYANHPLEIVEEIFDDAGFESSMFVSSEYDPTDVAYTSTISHWNSSFGHTWIPQRTQEGRNENIKKSTEATKATDLLRDLTVLLNGRTVEDEQGRIRFHQYDSSASVDDSWTDDDIGAFNIIDLHKWLKNEVEVSFGNFDGNKNRHIVSDSTSQTNFKYPGGNDHVSSHKIETGFLDNYALIQGGATISAGASSFSIMSGELYTFCGARWPGFLRGGAVSQPASAQLSSVRLGYLKIDEEIIEIDGMTFNANYASDIKYRSPRSDILVRRTVPSFATVSVSGSGAGRGAKGTTAAEHKWKKDDGTYTYVYDYTIAVALAEAIIDRHSNGVPVIECTTNFSKYNLQIGDFIDITSNRYRAFNRTSLTNAVKWEIIGKEPGVGVGRTDIKWTLAKVTDSAEPAVAKVTDTRVPLDLQSPFLVAAQEKSNESIGENHIINGMAVTSPSGFDIEIAPGIAANLTGQTQLPDTMELTMNASKDTYISWDTIRGTVGTNQTALGAGTPALLPGHVWLAKVVTDGSGVTSITDPGKVTTALDGAKLVPLTVDSGQIATDAITNIKMANNSVDTNELVALSVSTAKVAAEAVTAPKIGISSFSAYRSGSTQSVTFKTLTKVQFNSEDYDKGSDYDNATNYRWTAPEDCVADFNAQVTLDTLSNGVYASVALRVNGSTVRQSDRHYNHTGGARSNFRITGAFGGVSMTSGDYAEIWVYHDEAAGTRNVNYNSLSDTTYFTGKQIRGT